MLHRPKQVLGVRHLLQVAVEIAVLRETLPEFAAAVACLERFRRHSKDELGAGIEVGEHSIAIEEQMRLRH